MGTSSEFNKPYFYIETVPLENHEYTFEDKLWFQHKTSKVSLKNAVKSLISS